MEINIVQKINKLILVGKITLIAYTWQTIIDIIITSLIDYCMMILILELQITRRTHFDNSINWNMNIDF